MMQSAKIGVEQFWQVLRASQLVPESEIERLSQESTSLDHRDSESIASWLLKQKVITSLHRDVLQAGVEGPFDFGRYRILSRGPNETIWEARDRKTLHPVWLHFFSGDSSEDLTHWDRLERRAERFESIQHPNLLQVYQCVTTPKYRFVATSLIDCHPLAEKMPLKSRLDEPQAMNLMLPVASAIAEIERCEAIHGNLSLDHVFHKAKAGITKILPPIWSLKTNQTTSDVESLGRLLYRVLSGRDAPEEKSVSGMDFKTFAEPLSSRKISDQLCELAHESVCKTGMTAAEFLGRLEQHSGQPFEAESAAPSAAESEFVAGLSPWNVDAKEPLLGDEPIPDVDEEASNTLDPELIRKRKKRIPVAASIGLSLLGFAACLIAAGYLASSKSLDTQRVAKVDDNTEKSEDVELANNLNNASVSDPETQTKQTDATNPVSYVQAIVEDDQQTLWESPTTGLPIDISFVPLAPRIIAAINWSSIYDSAEGQQTLRSLGPFMQSQLQDLESRAGFKFPEIKSMIVSFHSNRSLEYENCAVVTLLNPVPTETCLKNWNQPNAVAGAEDVFAGNAGTAWWIAKKNSDDSVVSFVVGPASLIQRAASGEVAVAAGTLRNLIAGSDTDRDVNLIFPIISLFNTEGEKMFAAKRTWINELRFSLPQAVRGLLLSLHFDNGDYVEIRVDHTNDLNAAETVMEMRTRTRSKLEQISEDLDQRQAMAFWEPIRARFGGMLRELLGQLRWDSEFDRVVGNAWLPPGAFHNLFAATELAINFTPTKAGVAGVVKPKVPQTLEELLATRRDLTIANPPDLNVLLKNITEEVSDQYLEMPFKFNIQIAGTDLQKEGITQNQRPGALRISDESLSDILTQVMVSANPNREISGPADPNCKLVWVIDKDPDSGESFVLVTTRAAATANEMKLPDAFIVAP